ncbi:sporulation protein [Mechercharimyces sp. CAU 1602]|uniref:sporulation protein n=1 Tax=Mechercharimyces sp. CAU 1602 TaxID=2973933 RepID=UPI00216270E6|nr:sporulation protein [Mechercharimyces sp. CAU 1602]MCS1352777.1 sporulation protein [Mechercharimyces sp. CAU 1602]
MLQKALASFGVGTAKVDTRLEKKRYCPGEVIDGEVFIRGGQVAQRIDDIYLYLVTHVEKEEEVVPYVMKKYCLCEVFTIEPGEYKIVPFKIRLPYETPMSTGRFPVYFKTGLDIKLAVDPSDIDRVEVELHPAADQMIKEIEEAGFILKKVFCQKEKGPQEFVQVFHFRPAGRYHGYVDELGVVFHLDADTVRMEIDILRGSLTLTSTFMWAIDHPEDSFRVNNELQEGQRSNPFESMKSLLRQGIPIRGGS